MNLAKLECPNCNGELEFKKPADFHWEINNCPFCGEEEVEIFEPFELGLAKDDS